MSADEFDPAVERLFAQAPAFSDSEAFAAGVEGRLARGARLRTLTLGLAGVVGGVVAVREVLTINLGGVRDSAPSGGGLVDGAEAVQSVVSSGLTQFGLTNVSLSEIGIGSLGGMQLFWLAAALLTAVAAAGAAKLIQEI